MKLLVVFSLLVALAIGAEIGHLDWAKLLSAVERDLSAAETKSNLQKSHRRTASSKSTLLKSHQVRTKGEALGNTIGAGEEKPPWRINPSFEEILATADRRISNETSPYDFYNYGVCHFVPASDSLPIEGNVHLTQWKVGGVASLHGHIWGFEDNYPHGITIHEWGDLSQGCDNVGDHYNPFGSKHGGNADNIWRRHVGDLGNVKNDTSGNGWYIDDNIITMIGDESIIGRSFVIHEYMDDLGQGGDLESKRTGNSGAPIACCVIGAGRPFDPETADETLATGQGNLETIKEQQGIEDMRPTM